MAEGGFIMLLHAFVIGAFVYVFYKYVGKKSELVSQDNAVFWGGFLLVYMVLFGHGLPTRINPNIMIH